MYDIDPVNHSKGETMDHATYLRDVLRESAKQHRLAGDVAHAAMADKAADAIEYHGLAPKPVNHSKGN